MLEAWWGQICKTLAHYTSGNAKEAKRIFICNVSTSEEFGKIRQYFFWRHKMNHYHGSRRCVIAKAKIICAFIATEEEVNEPQIRLIVILLERKCATEPCYTNAHLRNILWKDLFKYLEGKCRPIFEFEKPSEQWWIMNCQPETPACILPARITQIAVKRSESWQILWPKCLGWAIAWETYGMITPRSILPKIRTRNQNTNLLIHQKKKPALCCHSTQNA